MADAGTAISVERGYLDQIRNGPSCADNASPSLGTSSGVNIAPGSDDDGWIVPPPAVLADGTRVQLYKDGEALHAAYASIQNAKKRICLEVYIFAGDDTGRAFADLLCQKARDGVEVYVIYDSFGSIATDRAIFAEMRRSGVHLQEFHPIRPWECRYSWRPANRDHRKLLIVDDVAAGLGGLNIGSEYAGSWVVQSPSGTGCEPWRDNAMGVLGPSAKVFLRAFAHMWRYVTTGGRMGKAELIYNIGVDQQQAYEAAREGWQRTDGRIKRVRPRSTRFAGIVPPHTWRGPHEEHLGELGLLASVPTMSSPLAGVYRRLIRDARECIQLTMAYFAPSDAMIDELCRAAQRGVRVQLMLPGKGDVPLLVAAARSFYEKLLSAGVEIYERQSVVLHSKTMVVDKEISIIGSANLDYRSIEYNCELSAIVRSRQFGDAMNDLFANDVHFARPIRLGEWRRRPWLDRLGQWAVNRARYLL